jgi:hypothetical protein
MSRDDYPPDPAPVDFQFGQLLRSIDPVTWGPIYEAGDSSHPLLEGDNVRFDVCTDCLRDVVDFDEIKRRYEANDVE